VHARIGKRGDRVLSPKKVNERWRVALAGLVAALAVPFLIVDSPAPAQGVETSAAESTVEVAAPAVEVEDVQTDVLPRAVEIVVTTTEVTPDISRLADQAGTWAIARAEAVADGRVEATFTPPPSQTDYSLLPVVNKTPSPEPEDEPTPEPPPEEVELTEQVDPEPTEPTEPTVDPEPEPGVDPEPEPEPEEPGIGSSKAPGQVDGRVPPPSGGPTAAQWNALRKCESTHNYAAVSSSGLYRGAYQFSVQTWDWVAGIHWPHLVGVDPAEADAAWQDVMAYTLYAMRGWNQWPICGKNLL
jgi:hypothetical protein